MSEQNIINAVNVEKDVDGFHPVNIGNLAMSGREPLFIPCAASGCIEVLNRYGVEIIGKKAVVIGNSVITGLPTSLLLKVIVDLKFYQYSDNIGVSVGWLGYELKLNL